LKAKALLEKCKGDKKKVKGKHVLMDSLKW